MAREQGKAQAALANICCAFALSTKIEKLSYHSCSGLLRASPGTGFCYPTVRKRMKAKAGEDEEKWQQEDPLECLLTSQIFK
jgi:hypothetical protein